MSSPLLPRSVTGARNGVNTAFTAPPYEAGSLKYLRNGILSDDHTETDPSTGAFTVPIAPLDGDDLFVLGRFP